MNLPLTLLTIATLALSACSPEPKPNVPPETPPAQPNNGTKGTSIELGDEGVKVQSKDLNVQVGSDTARVVLPGKGK